MQRRLRVNISTYSAFRIQELYFCMLINIVELHINDNPTIDRVVQHIINNVTAHECVENNHK